MLRVYGLLAVTITIVLAGMVSAASAIGAGRQPPPALRDFDACALPCWRAITPQATTRDEASAHLSAAGYRLHAEYPRWRVIVYDPPNPAGDCTVRLGYAYDLIVNMALTRCPAAQLGDLLALLGPPEHLLQGGMGVSFRGGTVIVTVSNENCAGWFAAHQPFVSVYLSSQVDGPRMRGGGGSTYDARSVRRAQTWRGFATRAFYAQHDHLLAPCT